MRFRSISALVAMTILPLLTAAAPVTSVTIDDGEARAVLSILHKLQSKAPVAQSDWTALFATEGYRRLKQREADFKRAFSDDDFKAFVTSPELVAKTADLQRTLDAWSTQNLSAMEARARTYLPQGAQLKATVYPLIKPKTNSFVYQLDTNPAIMLYIDPAKTGDQFSNTVSHELLHVGDAENCPPAAIAASESSFTPAQKAFHEWLGAFGEGWAVLAAAGGPNVHPHWEDPPRERTVWDTAMSHYNGDFADLESFFASIADGKLTGDAIPAKGFTYFGTDQGPWYTVGYKMDVTIEHELGRPALIASLCDNRTYLSTYDTAAQRENVRGAHLPVWPTPLTTFLETKGGS